MKQFFYTNSKYIVIFSQITLFLLCLHNNQWFMINNTIININNFMPIDYIHQYMEFLREFVAIINIEQKVALANLFGVIFILACTYTIVSIIYGEKLIDYLKLDTKFPRLVPILKFRKQVQQYYLILNFISIFGMIATMIYVNVFVLIQIL